VAGETLGSSTGEPDQTFRTTKAPLLPGQRVEVGEPEPPPPDERDALGADAIRDGGSLTWVRWVERPDLYGSGPRSRHYVVDRLTGAIRFGDGRRGLVPPQGRANVRASYRTGGGASGNGRPVGSINQLKRAVPYVAGARNEEPSGGGADRESLEAARLRGPRTLRHRDRAVAAVDFEDLALQASAEVARVRATGPRGAADGGRVALRVLPRGVEARPTPSLALLSLLRDYLGRRLSPTVELELLGPEWQTVTVTAQVVPATPEATDAVRTAALARLTAYLHPVGGGPEGAGWDFGRSPEESDFYSLLEAVPGVDHVRRLVVGKVPNDPPLGGLLLVCSGDHAVTVVGPPDPAAPTPA
jgi:predicted phage baseplate assembly protein